MKYSMSLSELDEMSEEERKTVYGNIVKVASSNYIHGKWTLIENYTEWNHKIFESLKRSEIEGFANEIDTENEI